MSSRNNVVLVNVFYKLFQFSGLSWSQLIDMFHLGINNNVQEEYINKRENNTWE